MIRHTSIQVDDTITLKCVYIRAVCGLNHRQSRCHKISMMATGLDRLRIFDRPYLVAFMLQCCVRCLSPVAVVCTECIVAKRGVLEQKLLLYIGSRIWEIDWYQNEWPWPLYRGRIKVMSTIASHSPLNISETVRDRGFWLGSKGPPIGNSPRRIKWLRDRWRHTTPNGQTRYPRAI